MAASPILEKVSLSSTEELNSFTSQSISNVHYSINVEFAMNQRDLSKLAESPGGSRTIKLTIEPEYDDVSPPMIDFSKVKFPLLENLDVKCQALKAVHFTQENTPLLKCLCIEQPCAEDLEYFNTDLPELESMSFQFVTIDDPSGFGKSLSLSPKLRTFNSYKLWGLATRKSKTHVLVLPRCESLDLYRSDDVNYLKIWAPRLEELNLQACYSITEVNLLDRKPNGYTGPRYAFTGISSKYKVNLLNTSRPAGNITTHQRCRAVFPEHEADPDDFDAHANFNPMAWWDV